MSNKWYLCGVAVALATAIACGSGDKSSNPVSPSAGGSVGGGEVGANGETLKVTAPTPLAPANGATLDTFTPNLQVTASVPKFQGSGTITHRFQLLNGSTVVREFTTAAANWVPTNLNNKTTYGWRARGEQGALFGPWSATWTFTTPDQPQAYMRGGELYDPLIDGKTIGGVIGPVNFIHGVGARLEDFTSTIRWTMPQTVTAGEFSFLATNILDNTDGGKTKLMGMAEGYDDITTNDRRFTFERRGNPYGTMAWRFITHDDRIETTSAERIYVRMSPEQTYLVRARWGGNQLTLTINEGAGSGREIYHGGRSYLGVYDPVPHVAYAGAPVGRGGPQDATIPGLTVRQVWLSANPRPAFANK